MFRVYHLLSVVVWIYYSSWGDVQVGVSIPTHPSVIKVLVCKVLQSLHPTLPLRTVFRLINTAVVLVQRAVHGSLPTTIRSDRKGINISVQQCPHSSPRPLYRTIHWPRTHSSTNGVDYQCALSLYEHRKLVCDIATIYALCRRMRFLVPPSVLGWRHQTGCIWLAGREIIRATLTLPWGCTAGLRRLSQGLKGRNIINHVAAPLNIAMREQTAR